MRAASFLAVLLFFAVASPALPAFAENREVLVVNKSSSSIYEFHASNSKTRSWEEDILGDDTIEPGDSQRINIDDGTGRCVFDFLAVMENGQKVERYGVNVCEVESWTISDAD